MSAVAQLVRADAVALVATVAARHVVVAAHGVPLSSDWLRPDAVAIITRAIAERRAVGAIVAPIPLGDGRTATSILAMPIPAATASTLVALRGTTRFELPDAAPMARAAELIAMDMRSASRAQELERRASEAEAQTRAAEDDRRFALALYELSRSVADAGVALERALAICTDVLGTDFAAVFSTDGKGLRVRASRPELAGQSVPTHPAIERARREGAPTLVHFEPGEAPAWAIDAREAIIAPLAGQTALLVLARRTRPFSAAETDGAQLLAAEIAPIVAQAQRVAAPAAPRRRRFALAASVLLLGESATLALALASGLGTLATLILVVPVVLVAGAASRGGRLPLLLALVLSALAFAERTSAPFLLGPRGDLAFGLETAGAFVALAAVVAAALALRERRAS